MYFVMFLFYSRLQGLIAQQHSKVQVFIVEFQWSRAIILSNSLYSSRPNCHGYVSLSDTNEPMSCVSVKSILWLIEVALLWVGSCLHLPSFFFFFCFTSCSSCWGNHAIWQPRWQRSSKQRSVTVISFIQWRSAAMMCLCMGVHVQVNTHMSQLIVQILFDAGIPY